MPTVFVTVPIQKGTRYRMQLNYPAGFKNIRSYVLLAQYLKTPLAATIVSLTGVRASVSFLAKKNAQLHMGKTLVTIYGVPVTVGRISIEALPFEP